MQILYRLYNLPKVKANTKPINNNTFFMFTKTNKMETKNNENKYYNNILSHKKKIKIEDFVLSTPIKIVGGVVNNARRGKNEDNDLECM